MSMYDAMSAVKTTTTGLSGGPAVVQMTAQDKEDQRPGKKTNSWLNLTPVSTDRVPEIGGGCISTYFIRLSLWVAKPVKTSADAMLEVASDTWEAVLSALNTGHLGGYSRVDVTKGNINDKWESGDDGDIAYVVRAEIPVEKQEG